MKRINLKKIVEAKNIDTVELANLLFPMHKHPDLALKRVLDDIMVLDADQISRFSLYSGIPIAELYEGSKWRSEIHGTTHVLTSGDYEAHLDTATWTTKIYHKKSLRHAFVLNSPAITLEQYIKTLELQISNTNE